MYTKNQLRYLVYVLAFLALGGSAMDITFGTYDSHFGFSDGPKFVPEAAQEESVDPLCEVCCNPDADIYIMQLCSTPCSGKICMFCWLKSMKRTHKTWNCCPRCQVPFVESSSLAEFRTNMKEIKEITRNKVRMDVIGVGQYVDFTDTLDYVMEKIIKAADGNCHKNARNAETQELFRELQADMDGIAAKNMEKDSKAAPKKVQTYDDTIVGAWKDDSSGGGWDEVIEEKSGDDVPEADSVGQSDEEDEPNDDDVSEHSYNPYDITEMLAQSLLDEEPQAADIIILDPKLNGKELVADTDHEEAKENEHKQTSEDIEDDAGYQQEVKQDELNLFDQQTKGTDEATLLLLEALRSGNDLGQQNDYDAEFEFRVAQAMKLSYEERFKGNVNRDDITPPDKVATTKPDQDFNEPVPTPIEHPDASPAPAPTYIEPFGQLIQNVVKNSYHDQAQAIVSRFQADSAHNIGNPVKDDTGSVSSTRTDAIIPGWQQQDETPSRRARSQESRDNFMQELIKITAAEKKLVKCGLCNGIGKVGPRFWFKTICKKCGGKGEVSAQDRPRLLTSTDRLEMRFEKLLR